MKTFIICDTGDDRPRFTVHRPGCRDLTRRPPSNGSWELMAPSHKEIGRAAEEDINQDFAGDYGQTISEFIDSGNAYTVDEGHIRVLPCCAFAEEGKGGQT